MRKTTNPHERSDGQLLRAAAEGDDSAFAEFCVRSLPTLLRVLEARLRHRGLPTDWARDAAQEAMMEAVAWTRQRDKPEIALGWLIRVASNRIVDWARQKGREERFLRQRGTAGSDKPTSAPSRPDVFAFLERLSSRDREMIELILLKNLSPGQVAKKLRLAPWAVYKRYERALSRLRELFAEYE